MLPGPAPRIGFLHLLLAQVSPLFWDLLHLFHDLLHLFRDLLHLYRDLRHQTCNQGYLFQNRLHESAFCVFRWR